MDVEMDRKSGRPYELQVVRATAEQLMALSDNATVTVWLWENVPEDVLVQLGIVDNYEDCRARRHRKSDRNGENPFVDLGIDAIARVHHVSGIEQFILIQAKDHARLGMGRLGTFFYQVLRVTPREGVSGRVVYSGKLDGGIRPDALLHHGLSFVHQPYDQSFVQDVDVDAEKELPALYPHQERGLVALADWARSPATRGILAAPPRTGKTRMMGEHIARMGYTCSVVLTPLIQYTEQLWDALRPILKGYRIVILSSGNARKLPDDIGKYERVVVLSTYDSGDLVESCIPAVDFVVVDEFHNLSRAHMEGRSPLGRVLRDAPRVLYVSGTPRQFPNTAAVKLGEVIFNYPLHEAIRDNMVCDYNLYVPLIEEVGGDDDVDVEQDDQFVINAAKFTTHAMLRTGGHHLIVFVPPGHNNMVRYHEALEAYATYQGLSVRCLRITCDMHPADRREALRKFQERTAEGEISVILSVRILNEAIDVPQCDSTLILSAGDVSERGYTCAVQRMARAMTRVVEDPTKVAKCFIFGRSSQRITAHLLALREVDTSSEVVDFARRIGVISATRYAGGAAPVEPRELWETEMRVGATMAKYVVDAVEARVPGSVGELCPALVEEWDTEKNDTLTPFQVTPGSGLKVAWRHIGDCGCEHKWEAKVANRVRFDAEAGDYMVGNACPFCTGVKVCRCKSVGVLCPFLTPQWHPSNNISPFDVGPGSRAQITWLCLGCPREGCGQRHTVVAAVNDRVKRLANGTYGPKNGCPTCSGRQPCPCSTLSTLCPDVAATWHPEKNDGLTPSDVGPGSNQRVWWRCPKVCSCGKHHEWQATVYNRCRRGEDGVYTQRSGCHICAHKKKCPCLS